MSCHEGHLHFTKYSITEDSHIFHIGWIAAWVFDDLWINDKGVPNHLMHLELISWTFQSDAIFNKKCMLFKVLIYIVLIIFMYYIYVFICNQIYLLVNILNFDVSLGVESMFLEVNVLKVWIHVKTRRTKMIGSWDLGHDAFSAPPHLF